jgi:anaerobic magnesium-protoporphyrin IX monomethyl ester cyclase
MNILLMGMPDVSSGYPTQLLTTPNLGLSSLAANLENNHHVRIADLVLRRKDVKRAIQEALDAVKPDLVGLSAMTFQYRTALKIASSLRREYPAMKIALGGYHATLMYEEIAESPDGACFDLLFRGEGDLSFNQAVNALEDGKDLEEVDGLSFRRYDKYIHNRPRELEDLSEIELPDRAVRMWNDFGVLEVPLDLIESSRGCLMTCNFCNIQNMYGRTFRTHKLERVMMDIERAKQAGTRILLFVDDNITTDVKHFESLCDEIILNGHTDMYYAVQASSAGIASSETLVEKMAKAGFKYVFLGIESPSRENLAQLSKGDIVEKSIKAVKSLQSHRIAIAGGFIIGNPDDDLEKVEDTYKFAKSLKTDFPAVQILVPYPKTKIRDMLIQKGLVVKPENYEMYDGGQPVIRTNSLDADQLFRARYDLGKKYLSVRPWNVLKTLLRQRKSSLPFIAGSIKLLPLALDALLLGWFRKLFYGEKKRFERYALRIKNLNKFDIV